MYQLEGIEYSYDTPWSKVETDMTTKKREKMLSLRASRTRVIEDRTGSFCLKR